MIDRFHKVYVGIDIHSREHKVAIIPLNYLQDPANNWNRVKALVIRNNVDDFLRLESAIKEHAKSPEQAALAIDHTGGHYSEPCVHFLSTKGYTVYHLEPKGVKAARERLLDQENKSDSIDAAGSAYLLYLRDAHGLSFRISAIRPELGSKASILYSFLLQRKQYNKLATQAINRLHQLLIAVFPEAECDHFTKLLKVIIYYPTPTELIENRDFKSPPTLKSKDWLILTQLASTTVGAPAEAYRELIKDLASQRVHAVEKLKSLDSSIEREVNSHPYGEVLLSFPGFGPITAAIVISVVKDISRWADKRKLKKAFGLYAYVKQSGTSLSRVKRGKEGNKYARSLLFQACLRIISGRTPENDFKDYYLRQLAMGKPKMKALVSTEAKLVEVIFYCLKTGKCYKYQGKYLRAPRHILSSSATQKE